uniref:Uncharacterized protein n=1 Tax=Romanomermis culicivorax TaxID=13658 RepID=A0A915J2Q3_ROMCU
MNTLTDEQYPLKNLKNLMLDSSEYACTMRLQFVLFQDAAFYALKLTQFRHIQHAVDILLKTNNPHIYGKAHLQRKTSFETSEGCSSRSESPMTPSCVVQSQSSSSSNHKKMHHYSTQPPASQNAPVPCLIQRTPSPMAKTGIVNAGGFFVQSSKIGEDTTNSAAENNRVSCFVRQKILPAVAQSKKVEKPSPQCAEKFQQDLLPQQFYNCVSVNNGSNNNGCFHGNIRNFFQQTTS